MSDSDVGERLLPREREVLALMAEGWSNAGIAGRTHMSLSAVEKHVSSVFGKLGLAASAAGNRRVLAVLWFLSAGGCGKPHSRCPGLAADRSPGFNSGHAVKNRSE